MIDHIFVSPGLKTIAANIDRTNDNARPLGPLPRLGELQTPMTDASAA
ncbi:MAG: hypothetical protein R3B67_13675 [Phycisphaerales bacterium]